MIKKEGTKRRIRLEDNTGERERGREQKKKANERRKKNKRRKRRSKKRVGVQKVERKGGRKKEGQEQNT